MLSFKRAAGTYQVSSISKGQLQRTRCDGVRANVDLYRIRYGDAHIRYHQGANKNQCVWGPHDSWSYPSQGRPRQDHPWACQHHGGHLLMTHGPLFVCAVSSVLKYRSPCTEEIKAANAFFIAAKNSQNVAMSTQRGAG